MNTTIPRVCIALSCFLPLISASKCSNPIFDPRSVFKLFPHTEDYLACNKLAEAQLALLILYLLTDRYHILPFELGTPYVFCVPLIMWIAWQLIITVIDWMFFKGKEVD